MDSERPRRNRYQDDPFGLIDGTESDADERNDEEFERPSDADRADSAGAATNPGLEVPIYPDESFEPVGPNGIDSDAGCVELPEPSAEETVSEEFHNLEGEYELGKEQRRVGRTRIIAASDSAGRCVRVVTMGADDRGLRMGRRVRQAASTPAPEFAPILAVGTFGEQYAYVEDWGSYELLADRLARGPLDEQFVARLGIGLKRALEALVRQGIVHRNLSPRAILLSTDCTSVRLRSFELAVRLPSHTVVRSIAGAPSYMAPEAARGAASYTSDLFSVGAVLFEASTGRPPFRVESVEALLDRVSNRSAPCPKSIRPNLSDVLSETVFKAIDVDPMTRSLDEAALADLASR